MENKKELLFVYILLYHSEAFQHFLQEISKQNQNNKCISFSLNGIGTTDEKHLSVSSKDNKFCLSTMLKAMNRAHIKFSQEEI